MSILEAVPIADPAGFAQRLVQEAGEGGGVVLDFTGPTVLPVLEAIEQQGLIDSVIWASSTPPNDPSVAEALQRCVGRQVPDQRRVQPARLGRARRQPHARAPRRRPAPTSRSRRSRRWATSPARPPPRRCCGWARAPSTRPRRSTRRSAHSPNVESDMLCKPWYFSSGTGRRQRVEQHRLHGRRRPATAWSRSRTASRSRRCRPTRSTPSGRRSGDVAAGDTRTH